MNAPLYLIAIEAVLDELVDLVGVRLLLSWHVIVMVND